MRGVSACEPSTEAQHSNSERSVTSYLSSRYTCGSGCLFLKGGVRGGSFLQMPTHRAFIEAQRLDYFPEPFYCDVRC